MSKSKLLFAKLLLIGAAVAFVATSAGQASEASSCSTCGCEKNIFSEVSHGSVCTGGFPTAQYCPMNGQHRCY